MEGNKPSNAVVAQPGLTVGSAKVVWIFGLSAAGKTTLAEALGRRLRSEGVVVRLLDGDDLRSGLSRDLGFSDRDRAENIRRAAEVAKLFAQTGVVTICSFITPLRAHRALARGIVSAAGWFGVYAAASYEICAQRDPKGLYARASAGALSSFTGMDSLFEPPSDEEELLVLATGSESPAESLARLEAAVLTQLGRVPGCTPASPG